MSLVTIIVPIYNAERYLRECIDSIIKQTHVELQIILVNDGSTDTSLEICEEYEVSDFRIEVLSQANSGASAARNFGIESAVGEWIAFVDADDIVSPYYVENLLKVVETFNCDMAICGLKYWNTIGDNTMEKRYPDKLFIGDDLVKVYTEEYLYKNGGPFSKLFRTELVKRNNIRFNLMMRHAEDTDFMMCYINHVTSIAFSSCIDYLYRIISGSLSTRKLSYTTECLCLEEMTKRYYDVAIRFRDEDLSVLKSSLQYYYCRVIVANFEDCSPLMTKFSCIKKISSNFNNFYTAKEVDVYIPYCSHERILLFLLKRGYCVLLLLYYYGIFKTVIRLKTLVK